jgi:flagellar hook protein FlgE
VDQWRHGEHVELGSRGCANNNSPFLTGFASPSATSSITQNGSAAGSVTNINIAADGSIVATIGAGHSQIIGQLALVSFTNLRALQD